MGQTREVGALPTPISRSLPRVDDDGGYARRVWPRLGARVSGRVARAKRSVHPWCGRAIPSTAAKRCAAERCLFAGRSAGALRVGFRSPARSPRVVSRCGLGAGEALVRPGQGRFIERNLQGVKPCRHLGGRCLGAQGRQGRAAGSRAPMRRIGLHNGKTLPGRAGHCCFRAGGCLGGQLWQGLLGRGENASRRGVPSPPWSGRREGYIEGLRFGRMLERNGR